MSKYKSKYINLYDAIMAMAEWFSEPITPTKILSDLPTIEVSEEKYDEWCHDCKEYDKEKHCCHRWNKVIRQTVAEIREQSSKVGEWENYKDEHRCSECGEVVIGDWDDDEWYDYCPNCGAKMKG